MPASRLFQVKPDSFTKHVNVRRPLFPFQDTDEEPSCVQSFDECIHEPECTSKRRPPNAHGKATFLSETNEHAVLVELGSLKGRRSLADERMPARHAVRYTNEVL